jgi:hypothetical protein
VRLPFFLFPTTLYLVAILLAVIGWRKSKLRRNDAT